MTNARVIDFDAFRAEQAEAPAPLSVKISGKWYQLAPALPAVLALDIVRLHEGMEDDQQPEPKDLMAIGAGLFGGEAEFRAVLTESRISIDHLGDLIQQVVEAYNVTPPNPEAPEAGQPT